VHYLNFVLNLISGAGKTTTMQMLTAEFPPTSGDATLAGFSISKEPQKTRRRIGYCPQFDAHFAQLSGRNHVELYASIKGIPAAFVKEAAALKLKEVGLGDYDSDRLCANYSGGMKRRLSLACATIGQPQIMFLDECSTGVDPVARREIWQLISDMVSSGAEDERASVILTTHSMEECEALCPRIGIMANGRLRCLGSAQHLKNKFGQGFQLELKTKVVDRADDDFVRNASVLARFVSDGAVDLEGDDLAAASDIGFNEEQAKGALAQLTGDSFLSSLLDDDPNSVGFGVLKDAKSPAGVTLDALAAFATIELRMRSIANFVTERFPVDVLRERQDTKARYEVSAEGLRISAIFAAVEEQKDALRLADYGVSQTSLEQVFNMHAAEAEKLKQGRDDR
jgi:ATP-binding cassette, subfamily A (ABC1), member 3